MLTGLAVQQYHQDWETWVLSSIIGQCMMIVSIKYLFMTMSTYILCPGASSVNTSLVSWFFFLQDQLSLIAICVQWLWLYPLQLSTCIIAGGLRGNWMHLFRLAPPRGVVVVSLGLAHLHTNMYDHHRSDRDTMILLCTWQDDESSHLLLTTSSSSIPNSKHSSSNSSSPVRKNKHNCIMYTSLLYPSLLHPGSYSNR